MQQHPVPQNVTQYQFRLVGDMTLKQFLELAGGLVLAYLFYASNLIFLFKWPLALLSVFFGIALAFFPLEDRPLDIWIINFLKAIYGPTRFIWKKTDKIPELFLFTAHPVNEAPTAVKTLKAPMLTPPSSLATDFSPDEAKKVGALESLLAKAPSTATPTPAAAVVFDKPKVTIRRLKPQNEVKETAVFTKPPTQPANHAAPPPAGGPAVTPVPEAAAKAPVVDVIFSKPTVTAEKPSGPAKPVTTISLPAAPKSPNLITGIVVDAAGRLVENAIVEVLMSDGIPARAMKTNALGQFFTTTPLSNGTYTIGVEKEGLHFPPQQLVTKGSLIPPIELRAVS